MHLSIPSSDICQNAWHLTDVMVEMGGIPLLTELIIQYTGQVWDERRNQFDVNAPNQWSAK